MHPTEAIARESVMMGLGFEVFRIQIEVLRNGVQVASLNRYQHSAPIPISRTKRFFGLKTILAGISNLGESSGLRRERGMDNSGAILCQISALKDMLDKVNEEIEANIQTTREIESEIVKCDEIETALKARESELIKLLYLSQFELSGLMVVAVNSRNSITALLEEIDRQTSKKDALIERLRKKRQNFADSCTQFQRSIASDESNELRSLLLEKESLENEIDSLDQTNSSVTNSVSAFLEEILEDLQSSNNALGAQIQRANEEDKQVQKQIDELRATLLSTVSPLDDPRGLF